MEDTARIEYLAYQQKNRHPEVSVQDCGLLRAPGDKKKSTARET